MKWKGGAVRWFQFRAVCVAALAFVPALTAQELPDLYHGERHGDPPFRYESGWRPLLNGTDLSGWHAQDAPTHEWFTTRSVNWSRIFNPKGLNSKPAPGDRIVNGPTGKTANLVTDDKFGSFQLYLEFMNAAGSNSGVYLHGLYEIQIFDSYGFQGSLTVGDCGGVYERTGLGGGSPPARNACRSPGEWQSLRIWFQAPRFDAGGKKIAPARMLRVLLNDTPIQEDVVLSGPTTGQMKIEEAARNPVMLQGNHGPVAFRDIYIKEFEPQLDRE
jgi:hypothetical protein